MEICQCSDCGKILSVNSICRHKKKSCKGKDNVQLSGFANGMVNNNQDSEDDVCKGVKRNKLLNQDQLDLPKEEIKIELKRRHDEKVERNEKRQKVMVIAEKINVSVPEELLSTDKEEEEETYNKETLRQEMIIEKRQYIAKI